MSDLQTALNLPHSSASLAPPGLSGSMNYDEASEDEEDEEEDRTRSDRKSVV